MCLSPSLPIAMLFRACLAQAAILVVYAVDFDILNSAVSLISVYSCSSTSLG